MRIRDEYKHGDNNVIDDNTGFKIKASKLKRQWDGYWSEDPDIRNEQDFVKGKADRQVVSLSRPEQEDRFIEIEIE